jgi:hypothetical protein
MPKKKEIKIPPLINASLWDIPGDPYRPEKPPFQFPPELGQGFFDMPFSEYLNLPLPNSSFYKEFGKTPIHGLTYLEEEKIITPQKQKNFDFGHAWHWLLLEPEKWLKRVFEEPGLNKNTNDYKAWKKTLPAGAVALPKSGYLSIDSAMRMRDKAMRNRSVRELLDAPGYYELTGIFQDPEVPAIWNKIRIDKALEGGVIVDLKSAESAASFGFLRNAYRFNYFGQAALYLKGASVITSFPHQTWLWIIQEKDPPHECRIQPVDPMEIEEAEIKLNVQMQNLARCLEDNHFPGYPDTGLYEFIPEAETVPDGDPEQEECYESIF